MENQEQPTPAATEAPAQAPAAPETPAPEKPAEPPPVVDVLGEDLGKLYPTLKEMEDGQAKGLKFPVERSWLDKQMEDPKFRAFAHGLRGVATREREVTVSQQKAIAAEREALLAEREEFTKDRASIADELAKFRRIVEALPKQATPAGGEPDPKNPDPRVQKYYANKYVAEAFEPLRKALEEVAKEDTAKQEEARIAAATLANQKFIDATSDYDAYHEQVVKLLQAGEARSVESAYHIAKARVLATKPAEVAAPKGPDLSRMSADDVAVYELEHPGWKRPEDWAQRIRR